MQEHIFFQELLCENKFFVFGANFLRENKLMIAMMVVNDVNTNTNDVKHSSGDELLLNNYLCLLQYQKENGAFLRTKKHEIIIIIEK